MYAFFLVALEILGVGSLRANSRCIEIESCTVVFLAGHFLSSYSLVLDTFAIGYIVQPERRASQTDRQKYRRHYDAYSRSAAESA